MLGLLVQLAVSWVLIWVIEHRSLAVLGLSPTKPRIIQFLLFFLLALSICSLGFLMKMYFGDLSWKLNPKLTLPLLWEGFWWNLKSVLFEEFIFRGVILFILIKRLGITKAVVISAAGFGIYHWFSFGVLGNIPQMVFVFIMTGLMGLVLAYGYARSGSLYLPIGIHLGWNFTQIFIFSQGPIGNGILVSADPTGFRTDSYIVFFTVSFLPIILLFGLSYLFIRRIKAVEVYQ